jgi:hypothetical protein
LVSCSIVASFSLSGLVVPFAKASNYSQAKTAITTVFGRYASQALAVARCETGGTYDPRSSNGQYLGIFQMGSNERATYGFGPSWLVQAAAAYQYFVDSGKDWSPWTCKPW